MKVDRVIPCVCCDHAPDCGDSVYYGMPILTPTMNSGFFKAQCPVCGRGGMFQYKSAYLALKAWNQLMEECYRIEEKELLKP